MSVFRTPSGDRLDVFNKCPLIYSRGEEKSSITFPNHVLGEEMGAHAHYEVAMTSDIATTSTAGE